MAFETLLFAREESFAVITLNRPPANAISVQLVRDVNRRCNTPAGRQAWVLTDQLCPLRP